MKAIISLIAVLALTGCQSFYEQPVPLREAPILYTKVLVTLVSPKWPFQDRTQGGMSICHTNQDGLRECKVYLREYPHFLGHEADHWFRGAYHGDAPNGDGF